MRLTLRHTALLLLTLILPVWCAAQTTHHVPADFPKIQQAIDASVNGDTVLVDPGTYLENLDFQGRAITVTSSGGAAKTIIDGGNKSATVSFQANEGRSSILSGFTIQNGASTSSNESAPEGGVFVYQSSPTIQNNTFRNNACNAVAIVAGAPLIEDNDLTTSLDAGTTLCYDTDNTRSVGPVAYGGVAIFLRGSAPVSGTSLYATLANNTIENNTQGNGAGGILSMASGWIAENNIIRNNLAGNGAALTHFTYFGGFTFAGNLLYGNGSTGNGFYKAAVDVDNSGYITSGIGPFTTYIDNNTMTGDNVGTGFSYASEIYIGTTPSPISLVNNILSGGTIGVPALYCAPSYAQAPEDVLAAGNNDIYNPTGGASSAGICAPVTGTFGNISADPQFTAPSKSDYTLAATSPALAKGNISYSAVVPQAEVVSPYLTKDIAGHPRTTLVDTIDMGAYQTVQNNTVALPTVTIEAYPNSYELILKPLNFTALISDGSQVVDFFSDGIQFGSATADQNGMATITSGDFTPGAHEITARDEGQSGSPTVSTPFFILVDKYTPILTLTSSLNPSPYGQTLTLNVTIQSTDTNQLTPLYLSDANGAVNLATLTPDANGVATYTTSTLVPGTHELGVYYPGDSAHNPVRAYLTETITGTLTASSTTTTLTVSPNPAALGQSVSFLTSVAANSGTNSPTGSISITDNGNPLNNDTLAPSGTATSSDLYTNSILALGTHTLIATYTPSDSTFFTASQSLAVNLVIANPIVIPPPADFNLIASPSPLTIATEHHAATTLTLTSINGFSGTVVLSCGTLPPFVTCQLPQPTVVLNSNATASTTLTLNTDALYNFATNKPISSRIELALAALLPLALFAFTRRRKLRARLLLLSTLYALTSTLYLTACSGKQPDHTPPGTYVIPITASGQGVTHTFNLTLVVTP